MDDNYLARKVQIILQGNDIGRVDESGDAHMTLSQIDTLERLSQQIVGMLNAEHAAALADKERELGEARKELQSSDPNYTPLLDSYAANCQRLSDRATLQEIGENNAD